MANDASDSEYRIKAVIDASDAVAGATETVGSLNKVAAGTDAAASASEGLNAAQKALAASAAILQARNQAGITQVAELGEISNRTADALAAYGIKEEQVSASARLMGTNLEIAARAMVQIEQSKLADELDRVRTGLEANADAAKAAADGTANLTQQQQDGSDDQYTDNLESISAQLEDNQKKGAKFTEEMGKMRESRRVAIELFETMEGGGHTIEGVTGLMRTLILTTDALAPEYAALVAIGLALAGIAAAHYKTKEAADDVAASTAVAADETKRFDDNLKDLAKDNVWQGMAGEARKYTEELQAQAKALDTIQKAQDQLRDAKTALRLATLDTQEQQDLNGKSGAEAEQIRARYALQKDNVRQQADQEKAAAEVAAAQKQIDDLEKTKQAKQREMDAAGKDFTSASENFNSARRAINENGDEDDYSHARDRVAALQDQKKNVGNLDDDGNVIQPLTATEEIDLHNLAAALPGLQAKTVAQGPQFDNELARKQAELAAQNKALDAASAKNDQPEVDRLLTLIDGLKGSIERMTSYLSSDKSLSESGSALGKGLADRARAADPNSAENAQAEAANLGLQTARVNQERVDYAGGAKIIADTNASVAAGQKPVPANPADVADEQTRQTAEGALSDLGRKAAASTGTPAASLKAIQDGVTKVNNLIESHQDTQAALADLAELFIQTKSVNRSELDRVWAAIKSVRNGGNN